jgi:hypothetical protein
VAGRGGGSKARGRVGAGREQLIGGCCRASWAGWRGAAAETPRERGVGGGGRASVSRPAGHEPQRARGKWSRRSEPRARRSGGRRPAGHAQPPQLLRAAAAAAGRAPLESAAASVREQSRRPWARRGSGGASAGSRRRGKSRPGRPHHQRVVLRRADRRSHVHAPHRWRRGHVDSG